MDDIFFYLLLSKLYMNAILYATNMPDSKLLRKFIANRYLATVQKRKMKFDDVLETVAGILVEVIGFSEVIM